jgi:toxin HigB-1
LLVLNQAQTPEEMDLPGFYLHPLKGERQGFWAVTVRANWRIIFRMEGGQACDVELLDDH